MQEQAVEIIKEILQKRGIEVLRMFLFGSRARGDARPDSDWDFLIVIDRDLSFQEKRDIIVEIQRKLAMMRIPNDIIIQSEGRFRVMRNHVGNICYYASKEGVAI